jgi:3-hydroxyisobutyrate dehydrogenase-like beta-hydroxyacid dehydrogenase
MVLALGWETTRLTGDDAMASKTIAILSPGDMGHNVGKVLKKEGLRIITSLAGRSERTRGLAEAAGFEDVGSVEAVAREADVILSIMPPDKALDAARDAAAAMKAAGKTPHYVDCNAISPGMSEKVGDVIMSAGALFSDAGIVGPGPGTREKPTHFFVSGPDAKALDVLQGPHIEVLNVGDGIGRASAVKMCYAAVTKGTWTLYTAALTAAEALGVSEELHAEFQFSRAAQYQEMERMVPRMPLDAGRWIGEMHEIAATLGGAGVTPNFHKGAADIFELLVKTPIAQETRETVDKSRTLRQAVEIYAAHLPEKSKE